MWVIVLASGIYTCMRLPYLSGSKQSRLVLVFWAVGFFVGLEFCLFVLRDYLNWVSAGFFGLFLRGLKRSPSRDCVQPRAPEETIKWTSWTLPAWKHSGFLTTFFFSFFPLLAYYHIEQMCRFSRESLSFQMTIFLCFLGAIKNEKKDYCNNLCFPTFLPLQL